MAAGLERDKAFGNRIFIIEQPAHRMLRIVLWMGKFQDFFSEFFNFLQ